jgi:glycerophosphoryl diester phosphodiesterase
VRFDLELKRVPFRPELIGDDFDGRSPALLERRVVEAVHAGGMLERVSVRSFDHRSVRAVRQLEPRLPVAVLVEGTAPVAPSELARRADAETYCPHHSFLDEVQVREAHAVGIRVVPWTVNDPADYRRLLAWGVDGITTDFPDRFRPTPPNSPSG